MSAETSGEGRPGDDSKKAKEVQLVMWILGGVGVLFIGIGIPLVLEKIGPNGLYGLRLAKAFTSDAIWYASNKVMGYDLIVAGAVIAAALAVLARKGSQWFSLKQLPFVALIIIVVATAGAVAHSIMALNAM